MPAGIGAVDLMLQIPTDDPTTMYDFLRPLLLDRESREQFKMPAEYMFKNVPTTRKSSDYVGIALDEMDKVGIARAMIGVDAKNAEAQRALREHPTRFFGSFQVNPNLGMEGVRELVFLDLWDHFADPGAWRALDAGTRLVEAALDAGCGVALASNFDERLLAIAGRVDPLCRAAHVFASSELGWRKPAAEFFRAVERRLGAVAGELLLVGDDPRLDVAAARAVGWRSLGVGG
jgi:FMN phosphatase YigB (HAD superfamily)